MRPIGAIFIIFGVTAIFWWFMRRVPWLMQWIYQWGETPAWAIKISFVIIGVLLFILGSKREAMKRKSG